MLYGSDHVLIFIISHYIIQLYIKHETIPTVQYYCYSTKTSVIQKDIFMLYYSLTGDTGLRGPVGEVGLPGTKGAKGDQGAKTIII